MLKYIYISIYLAMFLIKISLVYLGRNILIFWKYEIIIIFLDYSYIDLVVNWSFFKYK